MVDSTASYQQGSASGSLLERLKARDPEAWQRLIDLYTPLIYGWCRQCGLQAEDLADIGQEVFAAVASNKEGFRRDVPGASFRGWLWTITRNKVRDYFRRQKGKAQAQGGTAFQQRLAQVPEDEPESTATGARARPPDRIAGRGTGALGGRGADVAGVLAGHG